MPRSRFATASRVLMFVWLACRLTTAAAANARLPQDGEPPGKPPLEVSCSIVPDGAPCPGTVDPPAGCLHRICRSGRCVAEPDPPGVPCRDTDGDPLTVARCTSEGRCDQRAEQLAEEAPSGVVVTTNGPQALRPRSAAKCCRFCESQHLEALVPPRGPASWLQVAPNRPARRATFCGNVVSYDVNDESADPRDITLDLAPRTGSPFARFVERFPQTVCTPPLRCLHAEVTPPQQFYEVDREFLPIAGGGACDGDAVFEFGEDDCASQFEVRPTEVCVHGPFVFDHGKHVGASHRNLDEVRDGSHDHPEIHPFDAIWWELPDRSGHAFAVFQDDSNRYSRPHCSSDNNGNDWSQAPRDVTFSFPFDFPRVLAPLRIDVRRASRVDFAGRRRTVVPLNVTTAFATETEGPAAERRLTVGGRTLAEVVEEPALRRAVATRLEGSIEGNRVRGRVVVRVAVGCDPQASGRGCDRQALSGADPAGQHDTDDPGSGFFYGEIVFSSTAATTPAGTLEELAPRPRERFVP